jgi:hypothetical protein
MKNQVIEVLDRKHGKKVIDYWKSQGVDTDDYIGSCTKEEGDSDRYYGVINNVFTGCSIHSVAEHNAEIITLPEDKSFPRNMLVSNNDSYWDEKEVVAYGGGRYFVLDGDDCGTARGYTNAKEIDEPKTVTLTIDDLMGKVDEIKKVFGIGENDKLVITL